MLPSPLSFNLDSRLPPPHDSLSAVPHRRPAAVAGRIRRSRWRDAERTNPQGEEKKELSRILRTEAAVSGVVLKSAAAAGSGKASDRLWPRAVLEALESAVAGLRWESALEIFGLLRKQSWYRPMSRTYARLLMMLGKCRQPEQATALFRIMLSDGMKPTLDVYTALLSVYGCSGQLDKAFCLIDEMKSVSDCQPDAFAYTILINCCAKQRSFDRIPELLEEMCYLGLDCNVVTCNAIIDGYGKAGMFKEMEDFFSELLQGGKIVPDIYTMNSIVSAYGNCGRIEDMERRYEEFGLMGIVPDDQTFNILIRSYGNAGLYEKMMSVIRYMNQRFFTPSVVTYNTLINCFGRSSNVEQMEYYFRLMKIQGVKPNAVTYCSLVSGYCKAGILTRVPAIIRQAENTDVVLDTTFFNCVINSYGQAGELKIMEEMFQLMKDKQCRPDKITYMTMFQAYRSHGMNDTAILLEAEIKRTWEENLVLGPQKHGLLR